MRYVRFPTYRRGSSLFSFFFSTVVERPDKVIDSKNGKKKTQKTSV